ncbi:hypothetical protein SS50377_23840 [Spironucleus salmonicida]|uniref:Myb-like DNA-binding domain-containing protein n=1 Tax=Spironucleus salmonicida TaxID=348837 RepID=V6LHU1_9EUKA|nr:hypothetical protein SS50377_23838 [Spironucleus salmonicida]KAH0573905.1 hypothetical protein SS50377_23840 [Spironucleus salmonicida]|eukprot:EST44140.1 Hypothetical protein SS50377_16041 [Spironucleus salmonicida]
MSKKQIWSHEQIEVLLDTIREFGYDWKFVQSLLPKFSIVQLKNAYFKFRPGTDSLKLIMNQGIEKDIADLKYILQKLVI